ncbi:TetR/AcrR family transcriptional regulator [Nocardiopsis sp. NPDC050513]|uniref:TetR/AcrR family transcriptional regulator n=1 Tax=Nocardiopsis sp. NPDC050513 TaxID=3364338 RepID=UPI0037B6859E
MTPRRREIVRTQIAHAAVRLFTENGVSETTGDDIARELGISTRTLWRYFPSKEGCVRPLLTAGLDDMAAYLRACPAETSLLEFLEREDAFGDEPPLAGPVADLVRMVHTEPALAAVWLEVHHAAESVFADIIAERTGGSAEDLDVRVQAATLNAALRLAAEEWVRRTERKGDEPGMGRLIRDALATAVRGLPAFGHGDDA